MRRIYRVNTFNYKIIKDRKSKNYLNFYKESCLSSYQLAQIIIYQIEC